MEPTTKSPYRRAKTWHVALSQMTGIMQMSFYVLLGYASYIGNLGYAIATATVGLLITLSRVFDSVTDPIIAFLIEKFNSKHGKLRFFLAIGWGCMALATTLLCNVFAGNFSFGADETFSNPLGVTVFILIYALYIIGYTFSSCVGNMTGNILTNDPKQRPMLGVWSTIYAYLSPMIISAVIVTVFLTKFGTPVFGPDGTTVVDHAFTNEVFFYSNFVVVGVSFLALVLSCIGLTPYDKPENFEGLKKQKRITLKEMWSLLKGNKELRHYIVAACSDKLTQTMGSQSIISTLLFSVILGSMVGSTIISLVAMLPSIIFAFIGAKLAGKQGNKKVMTFWSWLCVGWNILFTIFIILVPEGSASHFGLPLVLFFLLMLGNNALKMVVSAATGAMRMDVVDYELYRSGNYMPATVSAVYSFIDKMVSAIAPFLASLMIGIIGYTGSKIPMAGDTCTMAVRLVTAGIYCGFPILGWLLTVLAMRKFSLTKEEMEKIQISIAAQKEAEKQKEEGTLQENTTEQMVETVKESVEPVDTIPTENPPRQDE